MATRKPRTSAKEEHELKNSLSEILKKCVEVEVSDIHIRADKPLRARLKGHLKFLNQAKDKEIIFTDNDLYWLIKNVLLVNKEEFLEKLNTNGEVDFSYEVNNLARFRINAYRQREHYSLAIRVIPNTIPDFKDLKLPGIVGDQAKKRKGLVLITGATGNGKTTTMASLLQYINNNYAKHIITIEDPIEFFFEDDKSMIDQRELSVDTHNMHDALSKILRQDPDVIVIGEIRDQETMQTALSAAGTGHLVISTLHTIGAAETFDRILSFFPENDKQYIRSMLSTSLEAIISQRLIPGINKGMLPATEVFVMTERGRKSVLEGDKGNKLLGTMEEGEYYQMHTFDESLLRLIKEKKISIETALSYASSPADLKLRIETANLNGKYDKQ